MYTLYISHHFTTTSHPVSFTLHQFYTNFEMSNFNILTFLTKFLYLSIIILSGLSQACGYLQGGEKCDLNSYANTASVVPGYPDRRNSSICDPTIPFECVNGRCGCKKGFTISRDGRKCLEIARNGLDSTCEENIQCWKGLLGRLSECDKENKKCRCYESETLPIVFHQGRCYYGESLGDFCRIDGLCVATTENAYCKGETCQCLDGFTPSWDKSRCLRVAQDGLKSPCEENVQCEKSPLGTLSECNQETMTCQCYQIHMVPTVFHQGRCYFGAALGDVCQVAPQCTAKTPFSTCGRDGKCHCGDNYASNENSTLCLAINQEDLSEQISTPIPNVTLKILGDIEIEEKSVELKSVEESGNEIQEDSIVREKIKTECGKKGNKFCDCNAVGTVKIDGNCENVKRLGEPCKFDIQCSTVTANSLCDPNKRICGCKEFYLQNRFGEKCLKITNNRLERNCEEDDQCRKGIFGNNSYCDLTKKHCVCLFSSNEQIGVKVGNKDQTKNCSPTNGTENFSCQLNSECNEGFECREGKCECSDRKNQFQQFCSFNCSGDLRPMSFYLIFVFIWFYL